MSRRLDNFSNFPPLCQFRRWSSVIPAVIFSIAASTLSPSSAFADGQTKEFKLPPIDTSDKARCSIKGSAIGQANAARDKLYDLRECDLRNSKAVGFDLSGVIMVSSRCQCQCSICVPFFSVFLPTSHLTN